MSALKKIWSHINKLAPHMRLSPEELKAVVAREGALRDSGSLKDLSPAEAIGCLKYLEKQAYTLKISLTNGGVVVAPRLGKNHNPIMVPGSPEAKMANKIKGYARNMGWLKGTQVDYEHLDNWLCTHGKFKKKLNAHKHEELVEVVTQMEKVYRSFLRDIRKRV